MIWINVAYLVGFIYGLFAGTVLSVRFGKRYTLVAGLSCFAWAMCSAAPRPGFSAWPSAASSRGLAN